MILSVEDFYLESLTELLFVFVGLVLVFLSSVTSLFSI
ncbi:hypothetical protein [Synechococcus phage S-H34]|uniref:Uncharacterized protein n=1 Tax=Synechococcus phage S-H34 TaxID=2718942 RepID=A0A6G8R6H5_9CAUD|nr:hypothetical protein PQC15_gp148 [Synechococcus phage S-H34]QIN97019.1 hypothetical protein [Synechococcus phage S-H34]